MVEKSEKIKREKIKSGIEIQRKSDKRFSSIPSLIKAGLEIHQQLDTHKLFCNCPSVLRDDKPGFEIKRRLHAVAGEEGEVDIAVEYEAGRDRDFIYQGYDTTCLVELDEEPPHLVNQEALQTALHISLLLNCKIIPICQIMRKTVIDGSNTSGFQRTVLIARDGYVETESGRVGIENVSLEEDAARIIGKEGDARVFRLDRLGIPLVEIGTAPDIKSAEQAKEVALHIGDILRSCKVKRGIGTIRQDINISIPKHPRVEIKGFQDVKMFIPTIEKEVERQKRNIKNKKGKKKLEGEVRKANPDATTSFLRPMPGAARMYPETDLPLLKTSRQIINEAKRTLPKLRTEIKKELAKKGLSDEMTQMLLKQNKLAEFEGLLKIISEPKFVYQALVEVPLEVARHEGIKNIDSVLSSEVIGDILQAVARGKIQKADVKHVMTEIAKGKSLEQAIEIEKADLAEVEAEIAKLVNQKPGLSIGAYMGLIMKKFKGQISGAEVNAILQRLMK